MNALRKSFKSHATYKSSFTRNQSEDQRPILEDSGDNAEVIVKVDDEGRDIQVQMENPFASSASVKNDPVWRGSSYDFWKDGLLDNGGGLGNGNESGFSFRSHKKKEVPGITEDPPSRLISSFLQKQKTSGGEMMLDMDIEMDELKKLTTSSSSLSSKEQCGSFNEVATGSPSRSFRLESLEENDPHDCTEAPKLRRTSEVPIFPANDGRAGSEVLRCNSNSSLHRSTIFRRSGTKSRLLDPPLGTTGSGCTSNKKPMWKPNRSGQIPQRSGNFLQRSGLLGNALVTDEEDDPFEDLPVDFKSTNISTWTILELIGLALVLASLICNLSINKLARQTFWALHLWRWEVLILVLISGRLLSGWFIRIIVFFLERNFFLRKRFLYFVYGLRKAVQNCIWLGLVLLAWHILFDKKVVGENKELSYITRILFCLIIATVLRLIKTLLLKVLASSFHVNTYFDRIQDALFNQYIIETLSGPPLLQIQQSMEEDEKIMTEVKKLQNAGATIPKELKEAMMTKNRRVIGRASGIIHGETEFRGSQIEKSTKLSGTITRKDFSRQQPQHDGGITIDQLHKLNQKNISAWNMKRMIRIVRHSTLATLDEHVKQGTEEEDSAMQIKSEHEAKVAAKKIFINVAKPSAKYIYLVDLMRFMMKDEAVKAMSLISGTQDDHVSKKVLKDWVVGVFRERRALSLTLNDTKTAVNKLRQIANVLVAIVVIAICLLILNITTTHFFVFLGSQILLLAFVFGNTFKMIFEAMIFLFVAHPFDVGDRCEVDGVQMLVEEMNILTTIFLRFDNQKITYPNSVLATLPIGNFYRSPDMGDNIDFCVHVSTPVEKLAMMRQEMIAFMQSKDYWHPGAQVVLRDVDDMNRLKISIWMRHRINFQDMGVRFTRRELVVQELIRVLRELDMEYRMLPVDVNVRELPSITSGRLPSTWATCS